MRTRSMLVVGYDGAEILEIACVTSALAAAGVESGGTPYDVRLLTPGGRTITCATGLRLEAQGALDRHRDRADTLIVSGGFGAGNAAADPALVGHVRRLAALSDRVAAVCTGAAILAAAGLLDGRRATTHWEFAGELARRHPEVNVDPDPIYVQDGRVFTSAGVTAALDLTIAFITADLGARVARDVARALVTYLHRPGNQAQISMHLAAPAPAEPAVAAITEYVTAHPGADLSTGALAARAGVTPRHLGRLFNAHLGTSPARYVRRARTEAAAHLLTSTDLPLTQVARRCGFKSTETLRAAFLAAYGVPPTRLTREAVP